MDSDTDESKQPSGLTEGEKTALFVVSVVLLVLAMVASIYCPYPSGKEPTLGSFIMLWGRELLILGTGAAVVIFLACAWVWKIAKRLLGGGNAP